MFKLHVVTLCNESRAKIKQLLKLIFKQNLFLSNGFPVHVLRGREVARPDDELEVLVFADGLQELSAGSPHETLP